MLVTLPLELKAALTYFITNGIKAFLGLFGLDVAGWASAGTAIVVGTILFFIEGAFALVPDEYVEAVSGFLALIVTLLSAFGLHYSVKSISA